MNFCFHNFASGVGVLPSDGRRKRCANLPTLPFFRNLGKAAGNSSRKARFAQQYSRSGLSLFSLNANAKSGWRAPMRSHLALAASLTHLRDYSVTGFRVERGKHTATVA
jgi:hypothetical protein